jgi:hypothetical protein
VASAALPEADYAEAHFVVLFEWLSQHRFSGALRGSTGLLAFKFARSGHGGARKGRRLQKRPSADSFLRHGCPL